MQECIYKSYQKKNNKKRTGKGVTFWNSVFIIMYYYIIVNYYYSQNKNENNNKQ